MSEQDIATEDDGWGPLDGLPGNPMMWILILGELAVFGALLTGFSIASLLDREAFARSQEHLHVALGGLNTVVLIASGWLAAVALDRERRGRSGRIMLGAPPWGSARSSSPSRASNMRTCSRPAMVSKETGSSRSTS